MSQFKYTLPSGAKFTMNAPAGTTQSQADYIFYSQVAAGALVGFTPGQSITGTKSSAVKFALSRLDRGTAGLDDTVILAIINGLPAVPTAILDTSLINVTLQNPITQASIANLNSDGFTAPAIGPLTSTQIQALIAQVANIVDQPANVMTDEKGVGKYGLDCQQLEMAGYVKPGTWEQFIFDPSPLTAVLSAPGIWTGLNGINSAQDFLNNNNAQNNAQATLMSNGYNSLAAAGVITPAVTASASTLVGQLFTAPAKSLSAVTAGLTNTVNEQVGALVNNASRFGTELTAQWASSLPSLSNITSSLPSIPGLPSLGTLTAGITPDLAGVKTAMDSLGKASQFAASATSTLTDGVDKLSNLSVSDLTSKLPSASDLAGQVTGQVNALISNVEGQANALISNVEGQANALLAQVQSQVNTLIAQGQGLVAGVQKAAGFSNTVNRATLDTATQRILGSDKIPTPSFELPSINSLSLNAAADIAKGQELLKNLQGQGTALLNQAQAQGTALLNQAQGQASSLAGQAQTAITNVFRG
jgi:hypothetical protein